MTFEMLEVLLSDSVCLTGLARIVTNIVNGTLDSRFKEYLLPSREIGIQKPGGGIRPIAIGEVLYRAAASFALYPQLASAAKILHPINLGVGVSGGCETVVHCVSYFLSSPSLDAACLACDFKNAFNSASRARMLEALFAENSLKSLWRLAHWAYSEPSRLFVQDRSGHTVATLTSEEGVRQGDPLASLLFCLGVQDVYRTASKAGKDVVPLAIMDDLHFVGAPAEVVKCYDALRVGAARIGLSLRPEKSKFIYYRGRHALPAEVDKWLSENRVQTFFSAAATSPPSSSSSSSSSSTSSLSSSSVSSHEDRPAVARILGVPLSNQREVVADAVLAIAREHEPFFKALQLPDLPVMHALLLLRLSGVPRFNYLLRCLPPDVVAGGAGVFDNMVRDTAVKKLQLSVEEESAVVKRLQMSIRGIGLGLRSATSSAPASFLSSQARASSFLHSITSVAGPPPGDPTHTAIVSCIQSVSTHLREAKHTALLPPSSAHDPSQAASDLWRFYSSDDQGSEKSAHLQHRLEKCRERDELTQAKQSLSQQQLARFLSQSVPGASSFLSAVPLSRSSSLSDAQARVALRSHLLLPPSPTMPSSCVCGANLNNEPYHHLHCTRFPGSMVSNRHNRVREVLAAAMRQAGAAVTPEFQVSDSSADRIDLYASFHDCSLFVDVYIGDPTAPSLLRSSSVRPLAAVQHADAQKKRHYEEAARDHGARLFTFGMEVTGALGTEAKDLICLINQHYQEAHPGRDPLFKRQLLMEIGCAVHQGNYAAVCAGLTRARDSVLRRASGRAGGRRRN
jgi:hypothetical protein